MGCRGFFAFGNVSVWHHRVGMPFSGRFGLRIKGKCFLIDSEVMPPEPKLRGLFVIHSLIGGIFT